MRFQYRGHFPVRILEAGESVCSAGDGTGACVVWSFDDAPFLRINPGDWIVTRAGKLHAVQQAQR